MEATSLPIPRAPIPPITTKYGYDRETEAALVIRGQAGDEAARNAVIMTVSALAWRKAHGYAQKRDHANRVADLYANAMLVLTEKFNQYDLKFGVRFVTWADRWIRQSCQVYLAKALASTLTLPTHWVSDPAYKPTIQTTAAARVASLSTQWGDSEATLEELLADPRGSEIDLKAEHEKREQSIRFVREVLAKFPPRAASILLWRQDLTLDEIGKRLNLSKERVRQIESQYKGKVASEMKRLLQDRINQEDVDKGAVTMDEVQDAIDKKLRSKLQLIIEVVRELGRGATYNQIRDAVYSRYDYKANDAYISQAKKAVFPEDHGNQGKGKSFLSIMTSPPPGPPLASTTAPAPPPATIATATKITPITLDDVREIKGIAEAIGGVDRLMEVCQFLKEIRGV